MFDRIDKFMDKILPDLSRRSKEREETTNSVVQKSAELRRESENNMFEAYRKAGIAVAVRSHHRRWED